MVQIKVKKQKSEAEIEQEKQESNLKKAGITDNFQARGFELLGFFQKHRTFAIGSVVALCCLIIGGFGWAFFNRNTNEKASARYQEALSLIQNQNDQNKDTEKLEKAQKTFVNIYNEYKRSNVAKLALIQAAYLSLELHDFPKAIEYYQSFLNATSKNNTLRPLALSGLAFAFEASQNLNEALKTFEEMARLKVDISADNTYWQIARLSKETGLVEKARENAQILLNRYPNSILATNAQTLLASLPTK